MADPMGELSETVAIRLDRTEKAVAQNADSISKLTPKIDGLVAATERLERSVDRWVENIFEQKGIVNQQSKFLELVSRQAEIIGQLTGGKAT